MTTVDPVIRAYEEAEGFMRVGHVALGALMVLHAAWCGWMLFLGLSWTALFVLTGLCAFLGAVLMRPWKDSLRRATALHREVEAREARRPYRINPSSN